MPRYAAPKLYASRNKGDANTGVDVTPQSLAESIFKERNRADTVVSAFAALAQLA